MSASTALVRYETDSGEVALSPQIVRQYLVNGQGNVTDQEVMMFLRLCQYQRLNPFLREAYLIKFGTQPATIVTGKEVFTKRAAKTPDCAGWEAGVVVIDSSGAYVDRPGALLMPGDTLVGGWAKVYRKDWSVPLHNAVALDEYIRTTNDGKPQRSWATMPATMIRKVALVQALREAFPESFQGLYSPEEMPVDASALPSAPVTPPESTRATAETPQQPPAEPEVLANSAQLKALGELAKQVGFSGPDMTKMIVERYQKRNSRQLTAAEADDLAAYLREIAAMADSQATVSDADLFRGERQ